jgi:hypothetical protein
VGLNGVILKTTDGGGPVGIKPVSNEVPQNFRLEQNYPNPFNPGTVVSFELPVISYVEFTVYDGLGREVSMLVSEELRPGKYEIEFDGSNFPSGVYFYRLMTADYTATRKMVIVK